MDFLKTICKTFDKPKLEKLCEKMLLCEWEKEILLELYAEPKLKTIDTLEYSNKANYQKRACELSTRVRSFLIDSDFLTLEYAVNLFINSLDRK